MNSVTLAIALETEPQLRYTADNQNPISEVMARFTEYETEHVIKLVRWGENPITNGIISGRLNVEGGDRPSMQITVEKCWEFEGAIAPINMAAFTGRAGKDPEIKYFESGSCVAKFSMAVNRNKKDAPPDWINVEIWGKTAQIAADYVRKGSLIEVQGALKIETWTDRNIGNERSKPVIKVDKLGLLGSKEGNEQYQQQPERQPSMAATATSQAIAGSAPDIDYADIPF